jgi:hypothetical protein
MPSKALTRIKGRMNLDPPCLLSMMITFFTVFPFMTRVPYPNPTLFVSVYGIPLIQDGPVPSISCNFLLIYIEMPRFERTELTCIQNTVG